MLRPVDLEARNCTPIMLEEFRIILIVEVNLPLCVKYPLATLLQGLVGLIHRSLSVAIFTEIYLFEVNFI